MNRVVSTNPRSNESRELNVEETSVSEVAACCEQAKAVAREFARRPLKWRASMLRTMADELEDDLDNLVSLALEETALTRARLESEVRRSAFQLRFFADVVDDGAFLHASIDHAKMSPMGALPDLRRLRVPIGVVGVFGSSNFPFAFSVPGGDTASALAAGCPVVIKVHPAHPATSQACFNALTRGANKGGAPDGLLHLIYGFEAGVALVSAPALSAVGFTGSVVAGRALWERANARPTPIPFYGELGAANPLVVTLSALHDRGTEIAVGLASSMTLGVGQFCTKPGLIFVPSADAGDAFVAALGEQLRELEDMTMLSAGIAAHFVSGTEKVAAVNGVTRLVGTTDKVIKANGVGAQLFEVSAEIFGEANSGNLREECFGPLAIIIRYSNPEQLVTALLATEPALTFSAFIGDDDAFANELLAFAQERAGRVIVNAYPTGVGVSWSMQHGGPWPSTTAALSTSVGAGSIDRWLRPVTFQGVPDELLPEELKDANPLGIERRVDGVRKIIS